jgi:hypothetical protein
MAGHYFCFPNHPFLTHGSSLCRRKPDGSDEQIDFPTSGNMVVAQYDDNLTSVTYGAIFASAAIEISLVLDYWG